MSGGAPVFIFVVAMALLLVMCRSVSAIARYPAGTNGAGIFFFSSLFYRVFLRILTPFLEFSTPNLEFGHRF